MSKIKELKKQLNNEYKNVVNKALEKIKKAERLKMPIEVSSRNIEFLIKNKEITLYYTSANGLCNYLEKEGCEVSSYHHIKEDGSYGSYVTVILKEL